VWNQGGERVEMFSNLLWVIYMSIIHLFPVAPSKISLFVQLSGALFLLVNLIFVKKISSQLTSDALVPILAFLLTKLCAPLNT
jgi:arabinofuranosyltransferase